MPTTLELQGAIKLKKLMQVYLPRALESREMLKVFPMIPDDSTKLVYERREVETGLQGARGLNGRTNPVRKTAVDQFEVDPGYYGDHYDIKEDELVNLREAGSWDNFESYTKQAARGTMHLTRRFLDRCEKNIADLAMSGKFEATDMQGIVKHRDVFNVPQVTPSTLFSDLDNATPLTFLRDLIPQIELGKSVSFMKGFMWMSRPTANLILKNANANDISGRRSKYGSTINSIADLNDLLLENDLPIIKTYDKGYYSDPPGSAPTFNRFLTNGKIVMVGVRDDGEQLGEYRLTRAAQSGSENASPGEWYQVEDRRKQDPCQVILRAGHNGGPVCYYTEGFVTINAAVAF
jgi:hypothetical protein